MNKRLWGHVPVGLVNVAFYAIGPLWGLGFTYAWLQYEKQQDANSQYPDSHIDILGMVWGLGAGMLIAGFVLMIRSLL